MTREIKFRCWDKVQGKMFEPSSMSWKNGSMWVYDVHGENKLECEMVHPNAELMQFTGLKDKQGKEIYEGDIIKHIPTDGITSVEWDDASCSFGPTSLWDTVNISVRTSSKTDNKNDELEVIGNIYSNPDLIKN